MESNFHLRRASPAAILGGMDTEATDQSQVPRRAWQTALVWTIREELALGNVVRIVLPGAPQPMIVEEATAELPFVIVSDPRGCRYYIGSMSGVTLLAQPFEGLGDGVYRPHAYYFTMTVEEGKIVDWFARDGTPVTGPNIEGDP